MRLKNWMKKNKYSYGKMAEELSKKTDNPITPSAVYKWANGYNIPKAQNIKLIQVVTFGKVTLNDFLD